MGTRHTAVQLAGTVTMPGSLIHDAVRESKGEGTASSSWVRAKGFAVHWYRPFDERGESMWPQRWSVEELHEAEQADPRDWALNMLNDPPDGTYESSPRTRGWSPMRISEHICAHVVPADAGVVPSTPAPPRPGPRRPRGRGGGPARRFDKDSQEWSSPRTRGWSRDEERRAHERTVVPADAGVVPRSPRSCSPSPGRPRGRGGGPAALWARGYRGRSSPRTRGWSPLLGPVDLAPWVVPADAGVVPGAARWTAAASRRPRGHGGGPRWSRISLSTTTSSPRTRGWSPPHQAAARPGRVVPADAGVVPGAR